MDCPHDWIEITTADEAAVGLRRFICVLPGCEAEKFDPAMN